MKKPELKDRSNHFIYFFNLLIIAVLMIMLAVVSIIYNNSLRSSPIFLFLLALGVGISSGIGIKRGWMFGLLLVSIWITVKQAIGVWSEDRLYLNLFEIFLAAITFITYGFYHDNLRAHFKEYQETNRKLKQFDLEDASIGLIKPVVGLLRLKEETDRAIRFRRPFSFILILFCPIAEKPWKSNERMSVMRAAATTIKGITRAMDIPFLVSQDKIGLILPDTEINGANKALNNILRQMMSTYALTSTGGIEPIEEYAQIRYGGGVFLGYGSQPFEMMETAEKSLQKNIVTNAGSIFQNLFIYWETVGNSTTTNLLISSETKEVSEPSEYVLDTVISPLEKEQQNNIEQRIS